MIDHIMKCADVATARTRLPGYCTQDDEGVWHWDGSRVIAPISIITAEAVWDNTDPQNPVLVSPEENLPGYWLAVALRSTDEAGRAALVAMDECSLVADRDAALAGQQFILYMGSEVDPQVVASARVAPVFAGSRYPFGALP